jgi:hypothetical protein
MNLDSLVPHRGVSVDERFECRALTPPKPVTFAILETRKLVVVIGFCDALLSRYESVVHAPGLMAAAVQSQTLSARVGPEQAGIYAGPFRQFERVNQYQSLADNPPCQPP